MTSRKKSNSDGNDITKKVVGITKKDKEIVIDQNKQGYFFVKFSTGGQLPPKLAGKFTRYEIAQAAVNAYLEGK